MDTQEMWQSTQQGGQISPVLLPPSPHLPSPTLSPPPLQFTCLGGSHWVTEADGKAPYFFQPYSVWCSACLCDAQSALYDRFVAVTTSRMHWRSTGMEAHPTTMFFGLWLHSWYEMDGLSVIITQGGFRDSCMFIIVNHMIGWCG